MRLLAVAAAAPWPPDSALRARTWNLLTRTAQEADVTLVTWSPPGAGGADRSEVDAALGGAFGRVILLPSQVPGRGVGVRLWRRVRQWAGGHPGYAQEMLEERGLHDRSARDAFVDVVRALHGAAPFDAVLLCEDEAACLPLPDLGVPVAIHRLNVFTRVVGDVMRRNPRWWPVWLAERHTWVRFDRATLVRADLAFTPTPESADALRRVAPGTPVVALPNGEPFSDLGSIRPLTLPPSKGRDVVFVGWMGYAPNVDAVRWFTRRCWPSVLARHPDAVLRIVGRDPSPPVRRLGRLPGVVVTGEVDDVSAACEGARLGVVPLRAGMGIKTKTLELMAMGLPVVST
ncbi:MAG TPA: glycosyltransferase, partial [Acidimicrobiia bacterium]|nr:glycosyltransferase [Acidimicrobiia bacterium]